MAKRLPLSAIPIWGGIDIFLFSTISHVSHHDCPCFYSAVLRFRPTGPPGKADPLHPAILRRCSLRRRLALFHPLFPKELLVPCHCALHGADRSGREQGLP